MKFDRPNVGGTVRLSILVPALNSAATIGQTLKSVCREMPPGVEIVIQDGGSSDATQSIASTDCPEALFVSQRDTGQSQALNRALERSSGDFVGWLNADDTYAPYALSEVLKAIESDDVDVVYGDFELIDDEGRVLRRYHVSDWDRVRFFRKGTYVFSGAMFIRRSVLLQVGGFDEGLNFVMDWDLLARLAKKGVSTKHLPIVLGQFRMVSGSKTVSQGWRFEPELFRCAMHHAGGDPKLVLAYLIGAAERVAYMMTRRVWLTHAWSALYPRRIL